MAKSEKVVAILKRAANFNLEQLYAIQCKIALPRTIGKNGINLPLLAESFTISSRMSNHVCRLPLKPKIVRGRFKDLWSNWCKISERVPGCYKYLDSIAAVENEKERHLNSEYWWVIHPFSYFRFVCDSIEAILYFVALVTIPFMISFVVMNFKFIGMDKLNLSIYAISWISIFLNFITGYYDVKTKSVYLDPRKTIIAYAKNYLIIDILSSLPYDHITLPWRKLPGQGMSLFMVFCNLLPMLKLLRYPTMISKSYQIFNYFKIDNFYYDSYLTLLFTISMLFWFTCICVLIPILMLHINNISMKECDDCWIRAIEDAELLLLFQYAFFIVLENIFTSGYGIIIPKTNVHLTINTALMILGIIVETYIIIMFLQIKAGSKASESKFHEIVDQLAAFTVQKQLPPHMKRRLLMYYNCRFKNSYFREKVILSNLSRTLRQAVAYESCRRLIINVPLFKDLPNDRLQAIIMHLKFEIYLPNDYIIKSGSQGDCMFFLATGTVSVLTPTGKEICHLDDGSHFGEVALLVPDQRRVASIIAIEVCEVYRLDRKDFRKCIAVNSELFSQIEKTATDRIQRTILVEEEQKNRVMLNPNYPPP
ncbi:potassium/sodium hyperpolarization-activated cyclic nucleotide-gated channel 1-like [Prorops nasuta]|uniref:potassium/sodium hyperpolarization-activated cyclic nucleotide-gated channel 1-like n=1 Tax=Prorops nasuta TaxID=863751 RepID=UPI0034CEAFB7